MKRNLLVLATLLVTMLLASSAMAQASATATANAQATIYQAIAITNTSMLNFGVIVPSAAPGTVSVAASAAATRTPTGGVTLLAAAPAAAAATFNVTGQAAAAYTATVSGGPFNVTRLTGTETMSVDNLAVMASPPALNGATAVQLYVGGRLNVAANQVAGTYENTGGPISVTVAYN